MTDRWYGQGTLPPSWSRQHQLGTWNLAKHSRAERERRKAQHEDVARIQAAWIASVPAASAKEFEASVAAARARGPLPPPPDMAPGTRPNPPRPGHEPKPPKDQNKSKRRY
jgi:hypothetical protein